MKKQLKKVSAIITICFVLQCLSSVFLINTFAATGSIKVQMYNDNRQLSSNTISPSFKIYNTGSVSVSLSSVKVKYYYTSDGITGQTFICDYAGNPSKTITSSTIGSILEMPRITSSADNYLEISFTSAAGSISPNSYIEVKGRIINSTWGNYDQSNDYSFNETSSTYSDWSNLTGFISNTLSWGKEPIQKFLIIVAKPIYSGIESQLLTYVNDLYYDGYQSEIITIDKDMTSCPEYQCSNAQELKGLIRLYYDVGYVGFVLVGSYPSIPVPYWTPETTDDRALISDYYYADLYGSVDADLDGTLENVTDWVDLDNNGIFDVLGYVNGVKVPLITQPEMFYGRIDAGGISNSISEQISNINSYFQKLHNFRLNRNNITEDKMKALGFYDVSFSKEEGGDPTGAYNLFSSGFSNIKIMEDKDVTNFYTLDEEMQKEYYFADFVSHGADDAICVEPWYTLDYYLTKGSDYLKSYYTHIYGCGTSRYLDTHYENGQFGTLENIPNMGEGFLFKNSRVVNVTGICASTWNELDQQYFADLSKMSIGEAYRLWTIRHYNDGNSYDEHNHNWSNVPCYVLLGDPTLRHPLKKVDNRAPVLNNNFSALSATVGQQLKVTLNIYDPENDSVTVNIIEKPTTAAYNASTKTITWTPSSSNRANGGTFVISVTDSAGNVFTEEFNVSVN